MLRKLTFAALVVVAGIPSVAATAQDRCFACIPNAANGGRLECVIVPCDGGGGGTAATHN